VSDEPPRDERRSPALRTALAVAAAVLTVVAVGIGAEMLARGPGSTSRTTASSASSPSVEAYRGLGSWVDIFDTRAWKDPAAAVADMASHGVHTLYLQTGNSHSDTAFKDVAATETFIREAHAHGLRVVAWYLPYLKSEALDLGRVTQAIRFRTPDGQSFDGFALDIESSSVKPESTRILALESLSLKIRATVGPSYPLGGIIPSPVGLARQSGYWDAFPYAMVAQTYDVLLPMAYYTYHAKGAEAVYADAKENIRLLRAQPGCATIPVHLIGGLASKSDALETAAFVRAVGDTRCIGASLYEWAGTGPAAWTALGAVVP
jgi:hypothetical protein